MRVVKIWTLLERLLMNNSIFLQKSQYDYIKRLPYIADVIIQSNIRNKS